MHRFALLAFVLALSLPASAARLVGEMGAAYPSGGSFRITFECAYLSGNDGPCTGTYHYAERTPFCSNAVAYDSPFTITNLNTATAGAFAASLVMRSHDIDAPAPGGACTVTGTTDVISLAANGTFDGTRGAFGISAADQGQGFTIVGSFTRETVDPFAMSVDSTIAPVTSNATATLTVQARHAGTNGSLYTFAIAPANLVRGGPTQAVGRAMSAGSSTGTNCVLAQLDALGGLVAVTPASMQASRTGVLAAGPEAVPVIVNAYSPGLAGATFFVGYGANVATMLSEGTNRLVLTVPGAVECRPQGPQTGWWWNSAEGGRGYSIERQGNNLFMAAYFYEADGRATWLVASGPVSLDGAMFVAPLYTCRGGVTLAGAYQPNFCTTNGNATLVFSGAATGTLTWPGGNVPIERFDIVAGGVAAVRSASQPESGWWWSSAENGRGFFIEWQGTTADIAGYMYDDGGNPIWYISVIPTANLLAMNGSWWQYANGMTMAGPYKPAVQVNNNVGPASIQFHSATTATVTLPGGRQIPLARFRF